MGDYPLVRMRLYAKLEALATRFEQAYRIISECGMCAMQKNSPGKWFAASVTRRLAEAGYPCTDETRAKVEAFQRLAAATADSFGGEG